MAQRLQIQSRHQRKDQKLAPLDFCRIKRDLPSLWLFLILCALHRRPRKRGKRLQNKHLPLTIRNPR